MILGKWPFLVAAGLVGVAVIAPLAALGTRAVAQSTGAAPGAFVIHFDRPVDPSLVTVMYALKDAEGWSGRYGVRQPDVDIQTREVRLKTRLRGDATALVAVVYCRGFRFAFVDAPSLADQREATLALIPLADLRLRGRVDFGGLPVTGPWTLEIGYDASAAVFALETPAMRRGETGAFGGSFISSATTVATTTVASDGAFVARVPDFLADPVVANRPGRFTVFVLNGGSKHALALAGQRGSGPGLDLATVYEPIALRVLAPRPADGVTGIAVR